MKTREEIEAMSDEERRIKTAKLCGWKREGADGGIPLDLATWDGNEWGLFTAPDGNPYRLPDYLTDLNAMAEAEKTLNTNRLQEIYITELIDVISFQAEIEFNLHCSVQDKLWFCASATARQRNTALLMIML